MSKYSQIITKLFDTNSAFVKEDFYEFVWEIIKKYPSDTKKSKSIDQDGNEYVREEIAIFEDINGEKLAIMTYKMPSKTKVERARSEQRNLISTYLRNEWVFQGINSVLVAFYSDDSRDWRLSFIKQEFKLSQTELDSKWRPKIVNELTPAKRYSFLVESNSKNLTVKQRLDDLLSDRVLISDIEKAFSVEKVSKEFFEKYVVLYKRLCVAFENDLVFKKVEEENNNGDEHFRENFVKKLLGQIVFLYFLQKKGWLWVKQWDKWWDGEKNYLQDLLKECLSGGDPKKELQWKNFLNDYLEHLFYDNLNLKRAGDYSEYFGCRIPYLNGWLFEPINGYDWKKASNILLAWDENNAIFKDIFATFDEYNFTVYENDPLEQDVAVDPEMLGKVFENLLPENERKWKWAFYTPREIVHYMCKESLKNHLMNKTGISEEKINGLFERKDSMLNLKKFGEKLSDDERYAQFGEYIDYAGKIVESLRTIKIVDPAVWSGAFPMGLLKEIVSLRKYLQESILLEDNVSEYNIKKETLENCIYGVDLDPGAVEIAKLRFWLSLVIEEESKESIDPLPNLDYKIMQWNSLIEDIVIWETVIKLDIENNSKKLTKKEEKNMGDARQIGIGLFANETEVEDVLKKLKYLHKVFFLEKDGTKKKALKLQIDHIEKELIRISGEVEVGKLKARIESIEWKYLLSGTELETKDSNEIKRLTSQIQSIKEMEEKYRKDNIRTFFPWKLHFAEVFNENGGFDICIGNPPYVWTKGTTEDQKKSLERIFWFADDLYSHFFFHWLALCRESWILSYITSKTYWTIQSKKNVRELLLKNDIIYIYDTENPFDTAMVDTSAILVRKAKDQQNKIDFLKVSKDYNNPIKLVIDKSIFENAVNKVIFSPSEENLTIYQKFTTPVSRLIEEWWIKINTSKNITKYSSDLEWYRKNLKSGDITLLGLITDGGQGLATANNGKFVGVIESTKESQRIRETRKKKLFEFVINRKITKYGTNLDSFSEYFNDLSEIEIRNDFDSLKEQYGRDIFGQGFLYRIINPNEIKNVSEMTQEEKQNGLSGERTFVPYDKGDRDGNRWYLRTPYYIDWSSERVKFLKENSGRKWEGMPVVRSPQFYFRSGFCWSDIHTVLIKTRLKEQSIHDVKSMSMFSFTSKCTDKYLVSLLNSTFISNYDFAFVNSTQTFQINDARQIPIIIPSEKELIEFEELFDRAYAIKISQFDEGMTNNSADQKLQEIQRELDEKVYKLYWLDFNEIKIIEESLK
ncbi:MAG: hypothetical protein ACD_71C00130G0008 [uncultured bacterium (gcode 4)]|uniref:site-specific DNA-methyltransferase (adenine-specific) n=1 Tax=uncultured bacterium (gcode 4) TaxID=1234023 RepID=K1Z580_9BACT|nr:MAG: hypothetical protein ACD_71C00130G0008 [uncultured bacterium (gcode 4)]